MEKKLDLMNLNQEQIKVVQKMFFITLGITLILVVTIFATGGWI